MQPDFRFEAPYCLMLAKSLYTGGGGRQQQTWASIFPFSPPSSRQTSPPSPRRRSDPWRVWTTPRARSTTPREGRLHLWLRWWWNVSLGRWDAVRVCELTRQCVCDLEILCAGRTMQRGSWHHRRHRSWYRTGREAGRYRTPPPSTHTHPFLITVI